jgi:hypothetical protein
MVALALALAGPALPADLRPLFARAEEPFECAVHLPRPAGPEGSAAQRAARTGEDLGEQRTLITLINFSNDPSTPFTVEQVETELLDAGNPLSTASWIDEVSYGRAWLTGDVLGWYPMPYDDLGLCLLGYEGQTQDVVNELDPLIDFSAYDRWIIFIPFNSQCPAGFSSLGKMTFETDEGVVQLSRAVMNGFGSFTARVAAHELGHSMSGLQHSADYECDVDTVRDFCSPSGLGSLGDPFDVMGESTRAGHFSAANKDVLGWLGPDVLEVPPPGGSYSLEPFESRPAGLKVLRIPVVYQSQDLARTRHYYVSYRKPLGFDAGFGELAVDGAMVNLDSRFWTGDRPARSWLLDMSPHADADAASQQADSADALLGVGQTFTDTERGISISVTGVTDGRLDVTVTVSSFCGNGVRDAGIGEECDGGDLGGADCSTLGRLDGRLTCAADCTFDTRTCGLARCAEGDVFDPAPFCRATILADPADGGLWRSRDTFTEVREDIWAKDIFEETWISSMMAQVLGSRVWFHKISLPFDTSRLPDSATILAGELLLKVVLAGGIGNTHPDSADQLVLVHPVLANPPRAEVGDYPNFGTLDDPVEGGPRIDVSDELSIDLIKSWPLDADGLSWIDPGGWSIFGVRTGFDVDNVWFPGEEMDLRVQFRASDSLTVGPRLVVDYAAAPVPAAGAAGAADQLSVDKATGGELALAWSPSCNGADSDYEIYEGAIGDFASHSPRLCSTGGATSGTLTPAAGDRYYLVVPRSADSEGSYGLDGQLQQRPAATEACVPQQVGGCGG